uniref:Uncharacterized protein n=1 Tax=Glossina brevipalpis TaxID=37001 RepID=A0A1A9WZB5_9MUSC
MEKTLINYDNLETQIFEARPNIKSTKKRLAMRKSLRTQLQNSMPIVKVKRFENLELKEIQHPVIVCQSSNSGEGGPLNKWLQNAGKDDENVNFSNENMEYPIRTDNVGPVPKRITNFDDVSEVCVMKTGGSITYQHGHDDVVLEETPTTIYKICVPDIFYGCIKNITLKYPDFSQNIFDLASDKMVNKLLSLPTSPHQIHSSKKGNKTKRKFSYGKTSSQKLVAQDSSEKEIAQLLETIVSDSDGVENWLKTFINGDINDDSANFNNDERSLRNSPQTITNNHMALNRKLRKSGKFSSSKKSFQNVNNNVSSLSEKATVTSVESVQYFIGSSGTLQPTFAGTSDMSVTVNNFDASLQQNITNHVNENGSYTNANVEAVGINGLPVFLPLSVENSEEMINTQNIFQNQENASMQLNDQFIINAEEAREYMHQSDHSSDIPLQNSMWSPTKSCFTQFGNLQDNCASLDIPVSSSANILSNDFIYSSYPEEPSDPNVSTLLGYDEDDSNNFINSHEYIQKVTQISSTTPSDKTTEKSNYYKAKTRVDRINTLNDLAAECSSYTQNQKTSNDKNEKELRTPAPMLESAVLYKMSLLDMDAKLEDNLDFDEDLDAISLLASEISFPNDDQFLNSTFDENGRKVESTTNKLTKSEKLTLSSSLQINSVENLEQVSNLKSYKIPKIKSSIDKINESRTNREQSVSPNQLRITANANILVDQKRKHEEITCIGQKGKYEEKIGVVDQKRKYEKITYANANDSVTKHPISSRTTRENPNPFYVVGGRNLNRNN